ncbi:MAG TPA: VCBS repeat-containing protein, partial [Pirellulales bacterium]
PIYDSPRSVLEESADLYGGSLVVVNVVDWNGDGALDIVAGNSCGYLLVYENHGTNDKPRFSPGKRIEAGGEPVLIQGEYRGSIQGPGESHWGYTSPCVVDWNGDGLPDIVMNDIRGMHTVYLNRGTKTEPKLALPAPLRADGLAIHGTWRTRPAAGMLGDRMAYVTLDDDDQVHLWWKIDDYNLEDGGKLRLTDSSPIQANYLKAGGEGRAKFQLIDWDGDGKTDLIVGTPRHATFPDPKHGIPNKAGASVLWLRNVGSNDKPVYEMPALMMLDGKPAYFGQHECSAVATTLGGGGPNIVVGDELGRMYFCNHKNISWKPLEPATGATQSQAPSNSPAEHDE